MNLYLDDDTADRRLVTLLIHNDPNRDMTPRQIVAAISHLESARVPLQNQVYILNHWR
jgi:hypothetical protein